MNFFKNFYKEIYNHLNISNVMQKINIFFNNSINYLFYVPLIYVNFYNSPIRIKYMINIFYLIYFYDTYNEYLIYCYEIRYKILEQILDLFLMIKIKVMEWKNKYFKNDDYKLIKVLLYKDLDNYIDVSGYFKNNYINYIDKLLIRNLYDFYYIRFNNDENIRLKIYFLFKQEEYIFYYAYNNTYESMSNYLIPYPPFTEEIFKNYRNDIVLPYYLLNHSKKKYFYSLFQIESKNLLSLEINGVQNEKLLEYFKKIQTPFCDFGTLYKNPVKLIWVLKENNIHLDDFETFYLKFLNYYFDEDLLDLKEHFIKLDKNDLDKYIISKRMEYVLSLKSKNDKNI